MGVSAVAGAIGFLSRVPVGRDDRAWEAFRRSPHVFPLVGYGLGALLVLPLFVPATPATTAVLFVCAVYLLTGVGHVDGLADAGDALAAHGSPSERREVMADTAVGAGGVLAVALVVLGLGAAGFVLTGLPTRAVGLVVVAEVGAKLAMATLVCLGTAPHAGLGSSFTERASGRALAPVVLVSLPALALTWPRLVPAAAALGAAVATSLATLAWARSTLGGVNGDVLGATNEIARLAALHAGVIAWTHF